MDAAQSDGELRRIATARWLRDQGLRDPEQISEAEFAELRSLLAPHKGFGIFMSILAYQRQDAALQLQNTPLGTPESDSFASRLQGIALALDQVRELVLDIADPIGERSEA